jgi:hypothetical protein
MSTACTQRVLTCSATQAAAAPDNPSGTREQRTSHDATTTSSWKRAQELCPQVLRSDLTTLSTTVSSPLQSMENEDPEMGLSSPSTIRRARACCEGDDMASNSSCRSWCSGAENVPIVKWEHESDGESEQHTTGARSTYLLSSRALEYESKQ